MKNYILYLSMFMFAGLMTACDENEIMPSYTTKGTATHTMAEISTSTEAPLPSENISIVVSFVNPSSDPLRQISLQVQIGDGAYTEIQSVDASSMAKDEIISQTFNYVMPATSGTVVNFDMVITSQKQYPQVKRASVTVQ